MSMETTVTRDAPAYLRPKEAAQYTGIAEQTLAKWRIKGRPFGEGPPFLKVGRAVLYRRNDLDRWLGEQSTAAE